MRELKQQEKYSNMLKRKNKEIEEGFMTTTEELCEAHKEIERLKGDDLSMRCDVIQVDGHGYVDIDKVEEIRGTNEKIKELQTLNKALDNMVRERQVIIDKAIKYILNNKLYCFKYDDEELFEITTDKKVKDDLLNILRGVIKSE